MTVLRGWGLPEQHLALDAIVAFVDGELTANAHDRAAAHLARCPACAADATSQRQARAAVQEARAPSISPALLHALQSIPSSAELPGQPEELALTDDGRLVTATPGTAPRFGSGPALGSSTPLGGNRQPLGSVAPFGDSGRGTPRESPVQVAPEHDASQCGSEGSTRPTDRRAQGLSRRTRQGAGVVFSGLVLGALAFINPPGEQSTSTGTWAPGEYPDNAVQPASAQHSPSPERTDPVGQVHETNSSPSPGSATSEFAVPADPRIAALLPSASGSFPATTGAQPQR